MSALTLTSTVDVVPFTGHVWHGPETSLTAMQRIADAANQAVQARADREEWDMSDAYFAWSDPDAQRAYIAAMRSARAYVVNDHVVVMVASGMHAGDIASTALDNAAVEVIDYQVGAITTGSYGATYAYDPHGEVVPFDGLVWHAPAPRHSLTRP